MQRRQFLAASTALLAFPLHLRSGALNTAVPRVALIGTGWYGKSDLLRLLQVATVEVVGLCDVDAQMLAAADELLRKRHPGQKPRLYARHEDLLAREKPDLVLIATPDHWHAIQAIDAMAAGANLYLQKPIGVDVRECESIVDAAKRYGSTVQVALQRRSTPHLLEMKKKYLDSGLIGRVHHVEMCCYYPMRDTAQREPVPVPASFDYEQWTGPAPMLPYKGLPHRRWRAFREYGNGIVGDMCVHYFDAVRWLLSLGWPERISSQGGIYVQTEADATTTDTQTAVFEYPERGLNCVWQHRTWGQAPQAEWPWSFTIFGTEGKLQADTHKYEWTPMGGQPVRVKVELEGERYPEDLQEEGIELHVAPATRAHLTNLMQALEGKQALAAPVEEGHISTTSCILANLALDLGRPLRYDPVARIVVDDPTATALLARPRRAGF